METESLESISAKANDVNNVDDIPEDIVERVFLFTIRPTSMTGKSIVSLATVVEQNGDCGKALSKDLLALALFERLMLLDVGQYLTPEKSHGHDADDAINSKVLLYLYGAYMRCQEEKLGHPQSAAACGRIEDVIWTNMNTCMRQPDLFPDQSLPLQWLEIFEKAGEGASMLQEFFAQTIMKVVADDEQNADELLGILKAIFYPMLNEIQKQLQGYNILTLKREILWTLEYFVRDKRVPQLGEVLIDYTTPNPNSDGCGYSLTLFGQLLSLSLLPKSANGPYEFFEDVITEPGTDLALCDIMANHQKAMFLIIKQLLVLSPVTKKKTLQWIANCLYANKSRGQLWSSMHSPMLPLANHDASDSFMIGLCAVLLRLCNPLCHPAMKVLQVDPTYCAVMDEQRAEKQVNMLKTNEETCLLPLDEGQERVTVKKYNFVTEVFYLTHKAVELGYRVCIEKFIRMSREIHNLQNAYLDAIVSNPNGDITHNLMRMLKLQMQQYLSLRNCLMEPDNDTYMLKFFEATAIWLTEISIVTDDMHETLQQPQETYAPAIRRNVDVPPKVTNIPFYVNSVPEYIIENIVAYLSLSRYFPPGQFVQFYPSSHNAFFKMIILFMGSSELVNNPHLRAKLAEALEFLLPKDNDNSRRTPFVTRIFDDHPDRMKVVPSLLNVFVSIEMTGQSVQFEQKFNYRRPMYAIMEYLWTKEEQVQSFRDLAREAELNMEAIEPPLFLRFINLLINDAIFLLDESLANLQQIRSLQEAQARGEWDALSANERQQHLSNLQHLGMLARFDNILGRDTINILKLLTSEIKTTFCHNSMVDRIVAMLNYFLLNLVGPQKDKFKVKDRKELEFDPAQTVLEICCIYINLSSSDRFCLAVSQDGRSYSEKLFGYAEAILIRIGGGQLIGEMSEFALKVKQMDAQYKQDMVFIADAPDEFLDPIMSTMMFDPVILPSSKVTVDRSTIARHLLSDQTDPFNRAPLTMDKVIANTHLKAEIDKWMAEKRASSSGSSQQSDN